LIANIFFEGEDTETGEMISAIRQDSREDEGLYTGSQPQIKRNNLNKMFSRLITQNRTHWLRDNNLLSEASVDMTYYKTHIIRPTDEQETCPAKFVNVSNDATYCIILTLVRILICKFNFLLLIVTG